MKDKKDNKREAIVIEMVAWSSVISIIFILAMTTSSFKGTNKLGGNNVIAD